ncbi:NOL1/NOP2/Sun domain family, member 5 [Jimgerdemannia flammicorona]|uniref:NOL1/NOP2/Sun domain family, member 5 n=1 Tax=Jimgerdemannia flammicorona TaxID=994334 RepID=A0A433BAR3_9FUNG|nr:NOL1/NOP2/Sun domain family, member 5 [Jimgerdemannia flammicorona]
MNFYWQAETILNKLSRHEGTIKSLTLGDDNVKDKKRMYALVCETLKYKEVINMVIDNSKLLQVEKKLPRTLALLFVHDLLFTKRGIQSSDGSLKQAVLRHQTRLKAELVKAKIKLNARTDSDLVSQKVKDAVHIPRYVRVNEHQTTVKKVLDKFQKEGYVLEETKENLTGLSPKTIRKDHHLPDLLVFPPNTDLHDHPLYLSGDIILQVNRPSTPFPFSTHHLILTSVSAMQDKASCFPAHVCRPLPHAHVIDACAAPGNKTSHLSALMRNTGKIWAFDLDRRRLELLKRLTGRAG